MKKPLKNKDLFVKCQTLIKQFLKPERLDNLEWPREIKIAQSLLNNYSEVVFKNWELGFKLNSLAYFKTLGGLAQLEERIKVIKNTTTPAPNLLKPTQSFKIEANKIDDDKVIDKCNKSMYDFLS